MQNSEGNCELAEVCGIVFRLSRHARIERLIKPLTTKDYASSVICVTRYPLSSFNLKLAELKPVQNSMVTDECKRIRDQTPDCTQMHNNLKYSYLKISHNDFTVENKGSKQKTPK